MKSFSIRLLTAILFAALIFSSCDSDNHIRKKIDPGFGAYIAAYTSGLVGKKSRIRIKLASPVKEEINFTDPIDRDLFDFSPSLSGKSYWVDYQTIEFVPEEELPSGEKFDVVFKLDELLQVDGNYEEFEFAFKVIEQDFDIQYDGLSHYESTQLGKQRLKGRILFADIVDFESVRSILSVVQNNRKLPISWNAKNDKIIEFTVDSILRTNDSKDIEIQWDGESIGIDKQIEEEVEVPDLGEFKITKVHVVQRPSQYVEIRFSDPIQKQNLDGMIAIENVHSIKYIIDDNLLKVYPNTRLTGTKSVELAEGIKNINGVKMPDDFTEYVKFEQYKPAVRLVGSGVIVPSSKGLIFPFEAVSLRAVDLYVTQVFKNNVIQFFQQNDYDGKYQLNRVGRNVVKKRINLQKLSQKNLDEWNRFYIDLADVLVVDPGTIYQVELRFNKDYSLYGCAEENEELDDFEMQSEDGWDTDYNYDNYWGYEEYNWRERDNPCNSAYYSRYKSTVSKNVMASNLGLLAKIGADKKVHVVANNLITTEPVEGVEIELFDYQQQFIAKGTTNSEGTVIINARRKPFIAIGKDKNQKAYLKLDDGYALSMSKFDVSGATVKNGIKGKLYGERGVWRPGDSLYLTFVLEDKEKILPQNFPVNFELLNPQGQIINRIVKTQHTNGFYDFRTRTDQEAITGSYTGKVKIGNRTFSKNIKIETVKPNRLKINFDFGDKVIKSTDEFKGKMTVKWLHGATASNMKAKVDLKVSTTKTAFKKYPSYYFDDVSSNFSTDEFTLFEDKLNSDGEATLVPDVNFGNNAPGMLRASFNTKVFEPGGNFSVDRFSILYSPYKSYVGIDIPKGSLWGGALMTGNDHTFNVVSLTEDGKPVDRENLEVKIYKIDWRWWWDSYDDEVVDFLSRNSTLLVHSQTIESKNGKASFSFNRSNDDWGRYLVMVKDPVSNHITSQVFYMDTPYWARANKKNNENATMLGFSSDKEKYNIGEKVKLTFPSPENGRALVCIENGTKVIEKYWVDTEEGETKFELEVSKEMTPNVFCNITLLQPHEATENDQPIRMFGVIPLLVENPETKLEPVVETEDVFRPETKTTIKVKEQDGKPMTYTLAVVDEGLLDLTRFKTPDLWNHFYSREALGVKTWDLYDHIMGAYGGELDKMLAIGGDEEGGKKKDKKANRFKPMVKFLGPFHLEGNDQNKHEIEIPNYIGSVRVMVVAGYNNAYGKVEKAVPVRTPLMVLGTLPRVLSPGESIDLPVNVFALEDNVNKVDVEVVTNDLLPIVDQNIKSISFQKSGEKVVNFKLKVAEKLGIATVKIKAKSGKLEALYEVELDVRLPNPPSVRVIDTIVQAGETWRSQFHPFGIEGTNETTVEVSTMPSIDLTNRLNYLIRYPHGCIEQTTSSVFPQLYLSSLMDLSDERKKRVEVNIKEGILSLRSFQTSDGGFSYWPGEGSSNEWGSSYAAHFLLEAENAGYALPIGLKDNFINYLKDKGRNWRANKSYFNDQLKQAYRLYVLALAGKSELGAMNRLREMTELHTTAKWRLAAAYALSGQPEVAHSLIENSSYQVKPYIELSYTYGSNIRDEAMILEALTLLKLQDKGVQLAIELAKKSNSDRWMSTQTTAYVLLGLSKYIGREGKSNTMDFTFKVNTNEPVEVESRMALYSNLITNNHQPGKIELENKNEGKLFVRLLQEGVPLQGDEKEISENVALTIRYTDMNGIPIDISKLKQSTDFIAEVEVYNPGTRGTLREMAIHQLFPSGWEIINNRMVEGPSTIESDSPTYQDIRDDRVYTYFDIRSGTKKLFRIQLNATYMGRFYMPGVVCEAMYDNTISAYVPGRWIEVTAP